VTFLVDGVEMPPVPLALVNGQNEAILTNTFVTAGPHTITARYNPMGNFVTSGDTQTQVVNAVGTDGPRVQAVYRFGFHTQPTILVLSFSQPLDPETAQNVAAYRIVDPHGHTIAVDRVVYHADSQTISLVPHRQLDLHLRYLLVVAGIGPNAVKNAAGVPLDGANNGRPGSNFVTFVTIDNWVRPQFTSVNSLRIGH
jgi:hypothetical protein